MVRSLKAVAVYPKDHRLDIADVPAPSLREPDEVLVRILEVGLCGTDREIATFEYGSPPPGSEYLVMGHEGLGEVLEVGSGVQRLKPGDLVVPTVRRPCGDPACTACAMDRQDFCFTGKFAERGIKDLHGFMTEQIVEREKYLHQVPSELRDVAVLTEPLTIARKALRQIFEVQDRLPWACSTEGRQPPSPQKAVACRRALVLGAGPVGLLGAMTLANAGFETIIYSRVSGISERVDIARAIGASFMDAEEVTPADLPAKLGQVDAVYEAVGASELAFQVLELLGPNAIFVFTGVPGRKKKATVHTDAIMRNLVLKNQALVGTVNAAPEDFDSAIGALGEFRRRWPGAVERLKTGRFEPERAPELLKAGHGIKNVIAF